VHFHALVTKALGPRVVLVEQDDGLEVAGKARDEVVQDPMGPADRAVLVQLDEQDSLHGPNMSEGTAMGTA
jgi:hypothetical protein